MVLGAESWLLAETTWGGVLLLLCADGCDLWVFFLVMDELLEAVPLPAGAMGGIGSAEAGSATAGLSASAAEGEANGMGVLASLGAAAAAAVVRANSASRSASSSSPRTMTSRIHSFCNI